MTVTGETPLIDVKGVTREQVISKAMLDALRARGEEVVPLDISVSFRDLPGLSQAVSRALARQPVRYGLEGTIGVEAGGLGEQVFGPMQLLSGELR